MGNGGFAWSFFIFTSVSDGIVRTGRSRAPTTASRGPACKRQIDLRFEISKARIIRNSFSMLGRAARRAASGVLGARVAAVATGTVATGQRGYSGSTGAGARKPSFGWVLGGAATATGIGAALSVGSLALVIVFPLDPPPPQRSVAISVRWSTLALPCARLGLWLVLRVPEPTTAPSSSSPSVSSLPIDRCAPITTRRRQTAALSDGAPTKSARMAMVQLAVTADKELNLKEAEVRSTPSLLLLGC